MNQLANFKLSINDGVATMSSLDMVEYINATRIDGVALLRHDSFMDKVKKVLNVQAPKFIGTQKYGNNISRKVYHFPKREACLMAMSYSYELQAQVFDAWQAAERGITNPAIPNFEDPVEAALSWVEQYKAKEAAQLQLEVTKMELAIAAPKVDFHDAVVASDETFTVSHAAKLLGVKTHWFFSWLRGSRYLKDDNTPYASASKFISCGYTSKSSSSSSFVTPEGLVHFEKILRNRGHIE